MKLAAKQLLALGVKPQDIGVLDRWAESEDIELRVLVQRILAGLAEQRRIDLEAEAIPE